ncbi:endopeptidase La [Falcatimonas sp. MSJ-15]|uniref:endopeptidase La n=1 Tax=Falcatimonas sp. MSJ-15 TaxID=2841515 RepID=UPI001C1238B4|nr:endopeptidase La [Falcatimonas sp. MSJ-15]MBU5471443.1 endopeptidase La [Falcatimonas sp. MSJ-15]
MSEIKKVLPVIALRGMTVLPKMVVHFDVSRKKSIQALEKAMGGDKEVFLVTQKNPEESDPSAKDLFNFGTVATIKQLVKMPNNVVRVLVEGNERAVMQDLIEEDSAMLSGEISICPYIKEEDISESEEKAMILVVTDLLKKYVLDNTKISKDVIKNIISIKEIDKLLNQVAICLPIYYENKQELLEKDTIKERYKAITEYLANEIEIQTIKKELQTKVKEHIEKNQKEYVLREQIKVIKAELGEDSQEQEIDNLNAAVRKLKADKTVKERLYKEIEKYKNASFNSGEGSMIKNYIDTLLELPWNKSSKDNDDLKNARRVLNEDHYGLSEVKERILEFLAVRNLTKKGETPVICLVGPPGTGKTSIARSVARALNKEYVRISLGGVHDEAEIRGHRRTYVGAMPGRIIDALKTAGVNNPLMLLDEVDKASSDYKGDTSAALLEVLDQAQNDKFRDHYVELPVDLSNVLFIATANDISTISKPLRDRMEIIEVSSYTENEKFHIAKDYLVSRQIEKNGLSKDNLTISENALHTIIHSYTREAGVRNLERKISAICRKSAREIVENKKTRVRITERNLNKYLGRERYDYIKANDEDEIGIVRGLAWTAVGGDTLQIEVNVMPGKGAINLTGQMGDVMKESAQIALTYVRSISEQYDIAEDYFEKRDIHLHIPEGAVPKDGPSAGITMATAILSAVTGRKVKASVAMTGEITLRGRVLPIGGLKEKLLAANMAGIKTVVVPEKNRKDVEELSEEITNGMKIVYASTMKDVLSTALC